MKREQITETASGRRITAWEIARKQNMPVFYEAFSETLRSCPENRCLFYRETHTSPWQTWNAQDAAEALLTTRGRLVAAHDALRRAHACATLREDGTCDGCYISELLGA